MKITVIGDTLLDVDLVGTADRLAPDGPVPVVAVERSHARAGGAGLVATLLARRGVDVTLVTAVGDDDPSRRLLAALDAPSTRGGAGRITLAATALRGPTPVKTRLRVGDRTVVRIDEGDAFAPVAAFPLPALGSIVDADAIVVADYGRGVTEDPRLRRLLETQRLPLVWDPHPRGPSPVHSATLVTPNVAEAAAFGHRAGTDPDRAGRAADELRRAWRVPAVAVTLGERGAVLSEGGRQHPFVVPMRGSATADACGAGDCLAAAAAIALGEGLSVAAALESGVHAASAFVSSGGVAALERSDPAGDHRADTAEQVVAATRAAGGTVVATSGFFDAFHAGHARTLSAARRLGDCLVVCLNSDRSMQALDDRTPLSPSEEDRRELLLALECVDAVVLFDEATPENAIRRLKPDVWVKADSRTPIPESEVLAEWGGRTVTVPWYPAHTTEAQRLRLVG